LAPSSFNWPGVGPLVNAKKQGIIAKNVVTIALIREGVNSPDLPGGTITYGAADKKNCGDVTAYVPAFNENGYPSDLSLEGITFGGVNEKPAAVAWRGDLSFETTALNGPVKVIDALTREAGAKSDGTGFYKIACDAKVPSLFLNISGHQYEIPPSELITPLSATDSDCIFNVFGDTTVKASFYLGASLARKYCLIFDYDNFKLGFAPNRYSN
ncbi:aspartic protease 2B, partial [Aphelenchoides avenae]